MKAIVENYFLYLIVGAFRAKLYDHGYNDSIGGTTDNRGWKKNLLEVEQVQDFTVEERNLGEVFIVKSEFSPTAYAIEKQWALIYEYYIKDEKGEMIRIGSGKINRETGKMETTISVDGQDRSDDIRYTNIRLEKAKKDGNVIEIHSSEYIGERMKISRKDIEQVIITKTIQEYLGKEKQIADITQVKDIPVVTYNEKGNQETKNAYIVVYVENGVETYKMVCIGEELKCEAYPDMSQDIFTEKGAIFKSKEGIQYSIYRDEKGILRVAEMINRVSGNGKYPEELDTYSVIHWDIKKIKGESKESLISLEEKNKKALDLCL